MSMFRKIVTTTLALLIATSLNVALAVSQISVTVDDGIKIIYNGKEQILKDANGNRVYPIVNDGTTYVPIRAVTQIFGENVSWDSTTRSVVLGRDEGAPTSGDIFNFGDGTPFTLTGYSYDLIGVSDKRLGRVTVDSVVVESANKNDKEETVLKLKITGKIEDSTMWTPTVFVKLVFYDSYGAQIDDFSTSIDGDKSGKTVSGTVTVTARKRAVQMELDKSTTQNQITY
jgi:hypothetical protein